MLQGNAVTGEDDRASVLYCSSYGGYWLSDEAVDLYALAQEQRRQQWRKALVPLLDTFISPVLAVLVADYANGDWDDERTDPLLIEIWRSLGDKFNTQCCRIAVARIPSCYVECYTIHEYDGKETVICNPAVLIRQKLRAMKRPETMSDVERLDVLKELHRLSHLEASQMP